MSFVRCSLIWWQVLSASQRRSITVPTVQYRAV